MTTLSLPARWEGRFDDETPAASSGFLARLYEGARLRREARRIANELSSLTDRELDDIGVRRSDIRDLARRSAR
ncbi:MAG: DUF1127 domain-containing protein [Geminicoccaceae bacterium]|nr:DUF1127 domain-containing protein [Geminicoccaceae bacterium]